MGFTIVFVINFQLFRVLSVVDCFHFNNIVFLGGLHFLAAKCQSLLTFIARTIFELQVNMIDKIDIYTSFEENFVFEGSKKEMITTRLR